MLDHLQREAFYGTAATQSVGSSPLEASLQFQRDQQAGKFPPASRFFFIPGYAPPNGGPDEVLREATNALHAINEVSTAEEARASVRKMAGLGIKAVKIWVDDRRGTYPKMTPEVYNAIIDEAHKTRNDGPCPCDNAGGSEGRRPCGSRRISAPGAGRKAG